MDVASKARRRATKPDPSRHDRSDVPPGELPRWRLYALRGVYLYLGLGLAVTLWPAFIQRDEPLPLMEGVVDCMLVALSVLFLVGIRYPTRMLPLLLFEAAWKLTWLATVALPLWTADRIPSSFVEMAYLLFWVAPVLIVIPWRTVAEQYLGTHGDRWR